MSFFTSEVTNRLLKSPLDAYIGTFHTSPLQNSRLFQEIMEEKAKIVN